MNIASQPSWLSKTLAWFDKHPEREFSFTKIPIEAIGPVGLAGWIVGIASQPTSPKSFFCTDVAAGAKSIPCIVRRSDAVSGRPLTSVFLAEPESRRKLMMIGS